MLVIDAPASASPPVCESKSKSQPAHVRGRVAPDAPADAKRGSDRFSMLKRDAAVKESSETDGERGEKRTDLLRSFDQALKQSSGHAEVEKAGGGSGDQHGSFTDQHGSFTISKKSRKNRQSVHLNGMPLAQPFSHLQPAAFSH